MCIWIVGGGGGGSSNRDSSRDESVEAGDESIESRDESIEAGEKHNNHVIILIPAGVKVKPCLQRGPWVVLSHQLTHCWQQMDYISSLIGYREF